MAEKAHITPEVLKWARTTAKISLENAASKIDVPIQKIIEWEEGKSLPTLRQAEVLAKFYRRPLALLFLPIIPKDFQPLQDFRRNTAKPLETASLFIIREVQQKQSWMRDFLEETGESQLPFIGKFNIQSDPKVVASDITSTLNIDVNNYQTLNPLKVWIERAEHNGIFISRTSSIHSRLKLDSNELKGFAIADEYAPFIFLNTDDYTKPQLFTLVHELAHLWIKETGISEEIQTGFIAQEYHPIEVFCNEVAANALMPESIFKNMSFGAFDSGKGIYSQAKIFGVSTFAFLYRAFVLKHISLERYRILKKQIDQEYKLRMAEEANRKLKQKDKEGGPNPYLLKLYKNGRVFTQIVLDAFKGGIIDPTNASALLNTKVNKFSKFEPFLYK